MTGYTLDELRACNRALDYPLRRYRRVSFAWIADLLTRAFSELNNALVEAMRNSNHDGKWN
jgi:hypothetical protein